MTEESFSSCVESKPAIFVGFLALLYVGLIVSPMQKIMWHDELFTFYIAQSPTFETFWDSVQHADWQPPLSFLTAGLSQRIFGANEFATRLPSVLAFFAASIGLLFILRKHVGIVWATVPILLLWFSFYFKYATEARPYGLLLCFFIMSLAAYLRATEVRYGEHRNWFIAGLLFGNAGMMLSHILAPLSMMVFGVAELARTMQRRKIDFLVWAAIFAPLGLHANSTGNTQDFQQSYFPLLFQASPRKMVIFFGKAFFCIWPLLLAGTVAALAARRFLRSHEPRVVFRGFRAPQLIIAATLLTLPAILNLVLMRSSGAFWERYCITTAVAIYVLCGLFLAWLSRFDRRMALVVASVVLCAGLAKTAVDYRPTPPLHLLESIRPDLPMVDASGLAFLEMDHYERPPLLKRLYYLTDRPSAIKYAHATLFEGFGNMRRYFPLRASVLTYSEFIRTNKQFIVFGTPEVVEDWLFKKLAADGAHIGKMQPVSTPYRDYAVYEVAMPE